MAIEIQSLPDVIRGIPFNLIININSTSDRTIQVTDLVFKPIGGEDSGVTIDIINSLTETKINLLGEYKDLYDQDFILYVPKGSATRIVDGFDKELEDGTTEYVPPRVLTDAEFEEQKKIFPSLVKPIELKSIEKLPDGQDLILALQDDRTSLIKQYDIAIKYNLLDEDNNILSTDEYTDVLSHTVNTSTKQFQEKIQNYYEGANPPVAFTNVLDIDTTNVPIVLDDGTPDTVSNRIFELSSSTIDINEGETLTISLRTNVSFAASFGPNFGIQTLVSIPYTITGISADDIESVNGTSVGTFLFSFATLKGNFIFAGNEVLSTSTIKLKNDLTTEGPETLTLTLDNYPDLSVSVIIQDTSHTEVIISSAGSNGATNIALTDNTGRILVDSSGIPLTTANINFTASQINTKLASI